jgi:hypothetical protein
MKEYKGDDVMFKIMECNTLNSLMKGMQREGYKKVYHKLDTKEINKNRVDKITLIFKDEEEENNPNDMEEHNKVTIRAEIDIVQGYIKVTEIKIKKYINKINKNA